MQWSALSVPLLMVKAKKEGRGNGDRIDPRMKTRLRDPFWPPFTLPLVTFMMELSDQHESQNFDVICAHYNASFFYIKNLLSYTKINAAKMACSFRHRIDGFSNPEISTEFVI